MPPEPDVPELDVGAVLGALERRGVKFVLIGGMAGVVHGCSPRTPPGLIV